METILKKELFGHQMEFLYKQESTDRQLKGCNQVRKASIRQFVWSNVLSEIYDSKNKYIFYISIQHTDDIDPIKWFDSRYESFFGTQILEQNEFCIKTTHLGKELKKLRYAEKLSISQMAKAKGVAPISLIEMENTAIPKLTSITKYLEALPGNYTARLIIEKNA